MATKSEGLENIIGHVPNPQSSSGSKTPADKLNAIFELFEEMVNYLSTSSAPPDDEIALKLADSYDAAVSLVKRLKGLPDNTRYQHLDREYQSFEVFAYSLKEAAKKLCALDTDAKQMMFDERSSKIDKCPANNYFKELVDPVTINVNPLRNMKPNLREYISKTKYAGKLRK
ncbi:hypothetical protein J4206_07295 [Candidatus Woesearchaeota archaeon]|nr:hypothetical protein [Candidatus Woesearchaeota archaeon]